MHKCWLKELLIAISAGKINTVLPTHDKCIYDSSVKHLRFGGDKVAEVGYDIA